MTSGPSTLKSIEGKFNRTLKTKEGSPDFERQKCFLIKNEFGDDI